MRALDPDLGDNGRLRYEIEKIWRYREVATIYDSHRFVIEPDTGASLQFVSLSAKNVTLKAVFWT